MLRDTLGATLRTLGIRAHKKGLELLCRVAPDVPDEPPSRFRTGPEVVAEVGDGDDLTAITGIGPVYAGRLADGDIASFASLANSTPSAVAAAAGVSENTASEWIDQATART